MSIEGIPSVASCRTLINSHVQRLIQKRHKAGSDSPVTDHELADLIQQLTKLKTETDPTPLAAARLDAIFRDRFANILEGTDIFDPAFLEVWILIDIITILSEIQCCEPALNFYLIEELLDSQQIEGCRKVFDYLESRRDRMIAKHFKEKKLVILRCCNELLRRLSRAEDTVFCGRVFIYMFQCFPLGDKNSINLRGEYHTDNITTFDPSPKKSDDAIKPMEIDTDNAHVPSGAETPASTAPDSDSISKTGRSTPLPRVKSEPKAAEEPPDLDVLYPKFWTLQSLFSSPSRLFDATSMAQFKEGLALTMTCFKSIVTTSTTNNTTSPPPVMAGSKRKRSDINGTTPSTTPFNPKYLTNRDLFDLEIHDLAFRRHILVQSLIMLDFLLSLSPTSKLKNEDLLNWVPPPAVENETPEEKERRAQPNKSVLYPYTLSPDDEKWCNATRAQIASYLQSQGPGNEGRMYTRMVETVLSRDKNWVRWKCESCPLISRNPISATVYRDSQKQLVGLTERKPLPNPPGANDFGFLTQTSSVESLKFPAKRYKVPSLAEYYKMTQMDDLDAEFAGEGEEKREIEERKAGRVWRALRASVLEGRRVGLCERLVARKSGGDGGAGMGEGWNLKALIGEDEEEKNDGQEAEKKDDGAEVASHVGTPAASAHIAASAAGTPAPIEEDATTPAPAVAGDGAVDEDTIIPEPRQPNSPKPEHIALLPTEEEGTPTPAVGAGAVEAEVEGGNTILETIPDAAPENQAEHAEDSVDGIDGAAAEAHLNGEGKEVAEPEAEDQVMDDLAPGGMSDAEGGR